MRVLALSIAAGFAALLAGCATDGATERHTTMTDVPPAVHELPDIPVAQTDRHTVVGVEGREPGRRIDLVPAFGSPEFTPEERAIVERGQPRRINFLEFYRREADNPLVSRVPADPPGIAGTTSVRSAWVGAAAAQVSSVGAYPDGGVAVGPAARHADVDPFGHAGVRPSIGPSTTRERIITGPPARVGTRADR